LCPPLHWAQDLFWLRARIVHTMDAATLTQTLWIGVGHT
jgi:hypothetical protein